MRNQGHLASGESNLRKNASIFLAATAYTCYNFFYNFYLRHRFLSSHAPTAQKETVSFVRACFPLSFECVHARSRHESLHLLFFCCHIKSDSLHPLSSLCFSFTQPLPQFSQRNLPRVKVHVKVQYGTPHSATPNPNPISTIFESASHNSPKHPPSRYTSSAEPTSLLPFPCFQPTPSAM